MKIKESNTMKRLNQIMKSRDLKQVDILNMTKNLCKQYNVKFNKSDLSQYVSGKTKPNQDKLFILSETLNVNESWLMGYDVPMEKFSDQLKARDKEHNPNDKAATTVKIEELIKKEYGDDCMNAVLLYNQLDFSDKGEIRGEMKHMLKSKKYSIKK